MNARQRMQGVVPESLGAALEREHREIDRGIESYTGASSGTADNAAALEAAIVELRRHIYLEEEFLFPALAAGNLVAPLFVMLRENAADWRRLQSQRFPHLSLAELARLGTSEHDDLRLFDMPVFRQWKSDANDHLSAASRAFDRQP